MTEKAESPPRARVQPGWLDRSSQSLLLSNLFTAVIALAGNWSVVDLMWVYWGQSVVIGFFNWKRMRLLQDFSTEGVRMNNRAVDPTPATRRRMAAFFAVHYGFFHLGYLVFLVSESDQVSRLDMAASAVCVLLFAANHRFSFRYNLEQDLARKPNIGTIMLFPYARIIPMHITIVSGARFAGGTTGSLILFMALKTAADWFMHVIEHRQRGGKSRPV